ncbi:MAG: hypothetical protein ACM3RX_06355, partial [Methanococcaceae archaeon]
EIIENALGTIAPDAFNYPILLYPAAGSQNNIITRIVNNGWQKVAGNSLIDISPSTDNKPFVAQLGMWKNIKLDKLDKISPFEFNGFPLSKLIIVIIICVVLIIIIPVNLLPYFKKGEKLRAVPWLYFFLIGMGFMMVEVVLMQKYTLFIGSSVYSIVTVLLTLLLSSGIGSRFADKISSKTAFAGIILWLLIDMFLFNPLLYAMGGLELIPRIMISVLLIAPLGFFMGMPFPKGTLKIKELIDWGFAVNGAASVLGSTLIILIAIAYGYDIALISAAGIYLAAFGLISLDSSWVSKPLSENQQFSAESVMESSQIK